MSLIVFKFECIDKYPCLIVLPRDEFRGYVFDVLENDGYICLKIDTDRFETSWNVPLYGYINQSKTTDAELVRTIGARMIADLDPSAPDIDVTWTFDPKSKTWEREERR